MDLQFYVDQLNSELYDRIVSQIRPLRGWFCGLQQYYGKLL